MIEAFPFDEAPRFLLRDRDSIHGQFFRPRIKHMGIEQVVTAHRAPWQSPYVERIIGSIRRECLNHVIVLNECHLRRMLTDYFDYYHNALAHLSLDRNSPVEREVDLPEQGKVVAIPQVGGLHHRYRRAAWVLRPYVCIDCPSPKCMRDFVEPATFASQCLTSDVNSPILAAFTNANSSLDRPATTRMGASGTTGAFRRLEVPGTMFSSAAPCDTLRTAAQFRESEVVEAIVSCSSKEVRMPTVQSILDKKGSHVTTVGHDQSVLEAAMLMNDKRIGAVVVLEGDRVVGIFTERDILRRVVAAGHKPEHIRVEKVMTSPMACCHRGTRLAEAKGVMTQQRVRHLPVVEDGNLHGMISSGDIMASESADQQATIEYLHEYLYGHR